MAYNDPLFTSIPEKDIEMAKKELSEIRRIYYFLYQRYSEDREALDRDLKKFEVLLKMFNKKYRGLRMKLEEGAEELKLRIFIPSEKNLKELFQNVLGKIAGLKSIGSSGFEKATVMEQEKFMSELDRIKDILYVSYFEQEDYAPRFIAEFNKKEKAVEVHFDPRDLLHADHPLFKLCIFYAVKGKIQKKLDVYAKAIGFGFLRLDETEAFLSSWNPKMDE